MNEPSTPIHSPPRFAHLVSSFVYFMLKFTIASMHRTIHKHKNLVDIFAIRHIYTRKEKIKTEKHIVLYQ